MQEVVLLRASSEFLFSRLVVSDSMRPLGLPHARLARPPLSPRVCSNACPLGQ